MKLLAISSLMHIRHVILDRQVETNWLFLHGDVNVGGSVRGPMSANGLIRLRQHRMDAIIEHEGR